MKEDVKLDQILCIRTEMKHAIEMFRQKQLHCLGTNLLQLNHLQLKLEDENVTHYLSPKIFWQCFNVNHFPFNHKKNPQSTF